MQIQSAYNQLTNKPSLISVIKSAANQAMSELNCVKTAIVQEFYSDNLTVKVLITTKKLMGLNPDGSQILREYPPIYAKICYCCPFLSYPITPGEECILLFSDRELESWFINGNTNQQQYPRMHDITDAIAIFGIRSLPNIIQILTDCLNMFYGQSNIALSDNHINITSGMVQASNFQAMNGASGSLIDSQGKKLADVEYGIITEIY